MNIKKGVRQGCVLSSDLFSLYSEKILREIKDLNGIKINGININNIRYADDTVLIAESEKELQDLLNKIEIESEKLGLQLNVKKTYSMVISKKQIQPKCDLKSKGGDIKQVENFVYLGSTLTVDGRSDTEIKMYGDCKERIQGSSSGFKKQESWFKDQEENFKMLSVVYTYVWM